MPSWIRPTSHVANGWANPANAYDGNTGTSATFSISGNSWSGWLEMHFTDFLLATQIRVYTSRQNDQISGLQFDVYTDGAWVNVYDGAPTTAGDYETVDITGNYVQEAIRVRFYRTGAGGTRWAAIHDTEMYGEALTPDVNINAVTGSQNVVALGGSIPKPPSAMTRLTVQANKIDAPLTDFPVYVNLAEMPASFWDNIGTDTVAVYADDETTKLDRELVHIDKVGRTGELWFKAPLLSDTEDTDFFIDYSTDEVNSTGVWKSEYEVVYHLNEESSTTADHYKDSTVNGRHGTGGPDATNHPNPPQSIAGQVGNAVRTNGTDELMATGNFDIGNQKHNLSIRAWVRRQGDGQSSRSAVVTKRTSYEATSQVGIRLNSSNQLQAEMEIGGWMAVTSPNTMPLDTWVLVHGRYSINLALDNGKLELFENGVPVVESGILTTTVTGYNTPLSVGGFFYNTAADNNRRFNGDVDEVRIGFETWSDAWIKAEYENEANFNQFMTITEGQVGTSVTISAVTGLQEISASEGATETTASVNYLTAIGVQNVDVLEGQSVVGVSVNLEVLTGTVEIGAFEGQISAQKNVNVLTIGSNVDIATISGEIVVTVYMNIQADTGLQTVNTLNGILTAVKTAHITGLPPPSTEVQNLEGTAVISLTIDVTPEPATVDVIANVSEIVTVHNVDVLAESVGINVVGNDGNVATSGSVEIAGSVGNIAINAQNGTVDTGLSVNYLTATGAVSVAGLAGAVSVIQNMTILAGVGSVEVVAGEGITVVTASADVVAGVGSVEIIGQGGSVSTEIVANIIADAGAVEVDAKNGSIAVDANLSVELGSGSVETFEAVVLTTQNAHLGALPGQVMVQVSEHGIAVQKQVDVNQVTGTIHVVGKSGTVTAETVGHVNINATAGRMNVAGLSGSVEITRSIEIVSSVGGQNISGLEGEVETEVGVNITAVAGSVELVCLDAELVNVHNISIVTEISDNLVRANHGTVSAGNMVNVLTSVGSVEVVGIGGDVGTGVSYNSDAGISDCEIQGSIHGVVVTRSVTVAGELAGVEIVGYTGSVRAEGDLGKAKISQERRGGKTGQERRGGHTGQNRYGGRLWHE